MPSRSWLGVLPRPQVEHEPRCHALGLVLDEKAGPFPLVWRYGPLASVVQNSSVYKRALRIVTRIISGAVTRRRIQATCASLRTTGSGAGCRGQCDRNDEAGGCDDISRGG